LRVPYPNEFIDSIPIFAPRTKEERLEDKYDKDFEMVDFYTGIYAFGYQLLNFGEAESLYRTVDSLLLSNLDRGKEYSILDIGCGVGRTLYNCAELYPNSLFIGMDYAYNMVQRAKEIILSGNSIDVDLSKKGFGKVRLACKNLKNVFISQGSVLDLPFKPNSFDCVVNTCMIDRVREPQKAIQQMLSVLKVGGIFIFTDPLSFEAEKHWQEVGNKSIIMDLIKTNGIEVKEWFDGLIYREIVDAKGNYKDWMTLTMYGVKK